MSCDGENNQVPPPFTASLRLWMPAPPLDNGLLQLTPEHFGASWVSAQTSSGPTETNQLAVRCTDVRTTFRVRRWIRLRLTCRSPGIGGEVIVAATRGPPRNP